jgi:hypothetical protein
MEVIMTHFSDGVRVGDVFPTFAQPGGPISPVFVYDVVPVALDDDGVAAAQAVAAAGNMILNGALVVSGVAVFDVPRAVSIDSTDAGDTTQTATVFGFDAYGQPMTETIAFNGTTAVSGQKAFARVTRVAVSAALAGNGFVGTTDILGLPYRADSRGYVLTAWDNAFVTTGTFVGADSTTPATATTNDTRGTFVPPTATDGSRRLTAWIYFNPATQATLYGVTQA